MIEVKVLVDKLNEMTCEQIRMFLLSEGIRGYVQDEHSCVLAQWIRRESGETVAVGVHRHSERYSESSSSQICVGTYTEVCEDPFEYEDFIPLSLEAQAFIGAFDNERYPELILDHDAFE